MDEESAKEVAPTEDSEVEMKEMPKPATNDDIVPTEDQDQDQNEEEKKEDGEVTRRKKK